MRTARWLVAVVLAAAVALWLAPRLGERSLPDPPAASRPALPPVPAAPGVLNAPPVPDAQPARTGPGRLPAPAAAERPPAPLPPVPFGVGETALYDVAWLGLGAGLSAGTAEFVVHDGGGAPGAAFHAVLTAVTAPWVSAFFEAHDRFSTLLTADLYPIEHRQELREGRRRVSRTARFDRAARLVRVGDGPLDSPSQGVSRAMPPTARDPLGAMYFVRTLDWDRTPEMRLLVSDLGLDLGVDIRAGRIEPVTAEGREQPARRLTVRMAYLTAKYQTPKATVWLGTDARRLPLVVEVETEVGAFRMALTRYIPGARPASAPPRTR